MKIVYMRSNPIDPDPRIEKEMSAAIESGHTPIALAWNREEADSSLSIEKIYLDNGEVDTYKFNINAGFGEGIKNLRPLVKWNKELLVWLIKNRKKYDLIHACDFDTVLPALFMNLVFKKKYIYDIFDFYIDAFSVPKKLRGLIKKIDFFAIKKAEATILVNESRREQISGSKPNKLIFIHNTPKAPAYLKENTGHRNFKKRIFYGGILSDNRMIEETMKICSRNKNWEFVVAGFGPIENKCKEYDKKFLNINFIGKLPYEDIIQNTIDSDVVFACYDPSVPNHKYSSPNKLYEAMMCKKPIIVCENTGIDKIVIKENIGLSCKFNEKSLEAAFKLILEDEEKYELKANNARHLYETIYKWDIMKIRLQDLYSNINIL